jgi:glycosyltransferase involved in cell wall biosynthesis
MTAHNTSAYISSAIESLREQSYQNIEIVVIDDFSTDDTPNIVQEIALRDSRVRYYRLPRNLGTFAAKTVGFEHARGDFVMCHDSDDWSHPEHIAMQIAPLLQNDKLIATASHWVRVGENGGYYAYSVYPLLRLNRTSLLFRKDIVQKNMDLWDIVRTGADSEFYARMKLVFGHHAIRQIKMPLILGAHRENSLMTAADTGYNSQGISAERLAYWEAWTHWHIKKLRQKEKPAMINLWQENAKRPFDVPAKIYVSPDVVRHCLG